MHVSLFMCNVQIIWEIIFFIEKIAISKLNKMDKTFYVQQKIIVISQVTINL